MCYEQPRGTNVKNITIKETKSKVGGFTAWKIEILQLLNGRLVQMIFLFNWVMFLFNSECN